MHKDIFGTLHFSVDVSRLTQTHKKKSNVQMKSLRKLRALTCFVPEKNFEKKQGIYAVSLLLFQLLF